MEGAEEVVEEGEGVLLAMGGVGIRDCPPRVVAMAVVVVLVIAVVVCEWREGWGGGGEGEGTRPLPTCSVEDERGTEMEGDRCAAGLCIEGNGLEAACCGGSCC